MLRIAVVVMVCGILVDGTKWYDQGKFPDTCLQSSGNQVDFQGQQSEAPQPPPAFPACTSWKKHSCCDRNITQRIAESRGQTGSEDAFDKCGDLSSDCLRYFKNQECFYYCEPMTTYLQNPELPGHMYRIPVCKSYADDWYNACKDDSLCISNIFEEFYLVGNKCPQNYTCRTMADRYGSAEVMVNTIWGVSYAYNRDDNNCFVLEFDPDTTPNLRGDFYTSGALRTHGYYILMVASLLLAKIIFG